MSFTFLAATFGAAKSSGWAIIPFIICRGITLTMANGAGTALVAVPSDMISILDPTTSGFAGNIMALHNITANNMNSALVAVMVTVTVSNVGGGQIIINGYASASGFSGGGSLTLDVMLFPANPAVLIH